MMLAERREGDLDSWLTQAEHSSLPEFKKMAHGIRQDYAAVKAAFASEWSNGQVEAQVNWRTASKTHRVREGQLRLDPGFAFSVESRGPLILTDSLLFEYIRWKEGRFYPASSIYLKQKNSQAHRKRKVTMTTMQMKLELVAVPVSDVDRAKAFYTEQIGFHADHDYQVRDDLRFVQLTPPGSACSIVIGVGITDMPPGSQKGLQMVVADVKAVRDELVKRGVAVSEIDEQPWGSFVYFSDPDGNRWSLQQLPSRT